MFHVFSLVCFLIYGVKRRQVLIPKPRFYLCFFQILHLSFLLVFCWLHKSRNTQGKIHGTYLGNIYGIYQDCIRSIHRYLWEKIIRNTGAAFGGAPMGRPPSAAAPLGLCFWWFSLIDIYGYSLYSPDIFHICFLDMFHVQGGIFPCVFLNLWSQE